MLLTRTSEGAAHGPSGAPGEETLMREPVPRTEREEEPEPTDPAQWKKWREARDCADVERVVREFGWPRARAIETPPDST